MDRGGSIDPVNQFGTTSLELRFREKPIFLPTMTYGANLKKKTSLQVKFSGKPDLPLNAIQCETDV